MTTTKMYVLIAVGALLGMATIGIMGAETDDQQGQDPLPFDPLSDYERAEAVSISLDDQSLMDVLSDRHTVIGTALYTDKSFSDLPTWPRVAEIWLYDYGNNRAINGKVDLAARTVIEWDFISIQPPVAAHEIEYAGERALEEERVVAQLGDSGYSTDDVGWTARLWVGSGPTSCPDHRCLLIMFTDHGTLISDFTVLVDLTEDAVVSVLGPHGLQGPSPTGGIV